MQGVCVLPPDGVDAAATDVFVSVPNLGWKGGAGRFVCVSTPGAAFSIGAFERNTAGFPRCVGPARLGFGEAGVAVGVDGVVTAPRAVALEPASIEVELVDQSMARPATTMFNHRNMGILALLPPTKKRGGDAVHGTATLANNRQELTLRFVNADGGDAYVFGSGASVTATLGFDVAA